MRIQKYSIVSEPTEQETFKVKSSKVVADYLRTIWNDSFDYQESFYVLTLDNALNVVGYRCISTGGTTATIVEPKFVAKFAIDSLCRSVILAHNHPSGNLSPSAQDKELTARIKEGLKLFDISVTDHVILTAESHYSFADEGYI